MRHVRWAAWLPLFGILSFTMGQDAQYSIKNDKAPVPDKVAAPIQQLLGPQATQLLDSAGKPLCTVWFRKEVPAEATPEQIKNGLSYRDVKQTEIIGVIRFEQDGRDYRKQLVKAGTYTLRLGYQPMDGDHTGASEFQDFLILLDAAKDTKRELMDAKAMIETSAKSIGTGHPGVLMLFPNSMPAAAPTLAALPKNHWVLQAKESVIINGKKDAASLGIGLTLVGAAD